MATPRDRITPSLAAPAAVTIAFLGLPLLAVVVRTPWGALPTLLGTPEVRTTLTLSLATSACAAALSLLFGMPLAAVLSHARGTWVRVLRVLVTMPIVLPPVVAGVALLLAFGRNGVVGQWLWSAFGLQIPFTSTAVIMAQTFVAMPFLIITLEGALRHADDELIDAAATAGASRPQILRYVTLPSIGPSVVAAVLLAWARAFGEFGATITFAGNFPGRTQTLPISVYLALETNPDAAIALSLVMLTIAITVLALMRDRWLTVGG